MELLVHDLEKTPQNWAIPSDRMILDNHKPINHCMGCFGCWVKTPGYCIIPDSYQDIGESLSCCHHVIIVSQCIYGTFSPFIKNVIDRSLSYLYPNFSIRHSETHPRSRYDHSFDLSVYFYGDCSTEEMETARGTVAAIARCMDLHHFTVDFFQTPDQLEGIL